MPTRSYLDITDAERGGEVTTQIRALKAEGRSLRQIAKLLRDKGIETNHEDVRRFLARLEADGKAAS